MSSDSDRIYQAECVIAVLRAQVTALQESLGVVMRRAPHLTLTEQAALGIFAEAVRDIVQLRDHAGRPPVELYRDVAGQCWLAARCLADAQTHTLVSLSRGEGG